MSQTTFLMIGGFLGAGKTTTIARLARHYMDEGRSVGIVTNDQAMDLVDTQSLRSMGFSVGEVAGACFCCQFDELVQTLQELKAANAPDVLISEPVGSCTDLIATVVEPLRRFHDRDFEAGPLVVLLKPEHGLKILGGGQESGFSPEAAYIFTKQLEEADVIALNKVDKLSDEQRELLLRLLQEQFPGTPCIAFSAKTGEGFEQLVEAVTQPGHAHAELMPIDYDIYAAGEAELGWLNSTYDLDCDQDVSINEIARDVVQLMCDQLRRLGVETAHLKVLVQSGQGHAAVANLVSSGSEVELSVSTFDSATDLRVTINARVAVDPNELAEVAEEAVRFVASSHHAAVGDSNQRALRPGRPVPTHQLR